MAAGGEGVISVVSNATPRLMARLVDWCASGDFAEARALAMRLTPWFEAAFIESNPIPVKAALAMMGRIENVLRLPLVPLGEGHTERCARRARCRGGRARVMPVSTSSLAERIDELTATPSRHAAAERRGGHRRAAARRARARRGPGGGAGRRRRVDARFRG